MNDLTLSLFPPFLRWITQLGVMDSSEVFRWILSLYVHLWGFTEQTHTLNSSYILSESRNSLPFTRLFIQSLSLKFSPSLTLLTNHVVFFGSCLFFRFWFFHSADFSPRSTSLSQNVLFCFVLSVSFPEWRTDIEFWFHFDKRERTKRRAEIEGVEKRCQKDSSRKSQDSLVFVQKVLKRQKVHERKKTSHQFFLSFVCTFRIEKGQKNRVIMSSVYCAHMCYVEISLSFPFFFSWHQEVLSFLRTHWSIFPFFLQWYLELFRGIHTIGKEEKK